MIRTGTYPATLTGLFPNSISPPRVDSRLTEPAKLSFVAGQTLRIPVSVLDSWNRPWLVPTEVDLIFTLRAADGSLAFSVKADLAFPALSATTPTVAHGYVQLLPADTLSLSGAYQLDLSAVWSDGSGARVTLRQGTATISKALSLPTDSPATRAALVPSLFQEPTTKPTACLAVLDSKAAGGELATCSRGGWQRHFQHMCNLNGKHIVWVGANVMPVQPFGANVNSPPTSVDGIPWFPMVAGVSGGSLTNVAGGILMSGLVPIYVSTYMPTGGVLFCDAGVNDGQLGATVNNALAAYDTMLTACFAAATAGSLTIIVNRIAPGGQTLNPALYINYSREPWTAQFNAGLDGIVATRKAAGQKIYSVDVYNRFLRYVGPLGENWSGAINGVGLSLVGQGLADCPGLLGDGTHPNDAGQKATAEEVFLVASPFLADRQ